MRKQARDAALAAELAAAATALGQAPGGGAPAVAAAVAAVSAAQGIGQARSEGQAVNAEDEDMQSLSEDAAAPIASALLRAQAEEIARLKAALQQQPAGHGLAGSAVQPPAASPQGSPRSSPQASPLGSPVGPRASRPQARLSDLPSYAGESGAKLDDWLQKLRRCARYFQMSEVEAVEFSLVHLEGAADVWWQALADAEQATASVSVESLAAALRGRFQPITTARVAREQLHRLQQGTRPVDAYIAEFNLLQARVPDMAEAEARPLFVRGLRREIADKIEDDDWEAMPLAKIVAKAARIGNRAAGVASSLPSGPRAAANQMEVDSGAEFEAAVNRAVLNALAAQGPPGNATSSGSGLGAKTQTQRGYDSARGRGSFGGQRGGSQGRFQARPLPSIPGVPAHIVEQRRAAGVCYRCGGDHRSMECPSAPSAQQPTN